MKVEAVGSLRLELSDFPPAWSVVDLHREFSVFGPLTAFKIVEPGRNAFVQFADAASARTAFVARQKPAAKPHGKLTVQVGPRGQREVKSDAGTAPLLFKEVEDMSPVKVDFSRPPPPLKVPPPPPTIPFKFSTDDIARRTQISTEGELHPIKVTSVVSLPQFWVVKTVALPVREAVRSYAAEMKDTPFWDWSKYPAPGDTFLLDNERVRVEELVGPDVKLFYLDKGASVTHPPFPQLREMPSALRNVPDLAVAVSLDAANMPSIERFKKEIRTESLQLKLLPKSEENVKRVRLFRGNQELFRDTPIEQPNANRKDQNVKKESLPCKRNPSKNESKTNDAQDLFVTSWNEDKKDSSNETTSDSSNCKNKSNQPRERNVRPEVNEIVGIMNLQKAGIKPGSGRRREIAPGMTSKSDRGKFTTLSENEQQFAKQNKREHSRVTPEQQGDVQCGAKENSLPLKKVNVGLEKMSLQSDREASSKQGARMPASHETDSSFKPSDPNGIAKAKLVSFENPSQFVMRVDGTDISCRLNGLTPVGSNSWSPDSIESAEIALDEFLDEGGFCMLKIVRRNPREQIHDVEVIADTEILTDILVSEAPHLFAKLLTVDDLPQMEPESLGNLITFSSVSDYMNQIYFTFQSMVQDNRKLHREIANLEPKPILDASKLRPGSLCLAEFENNLYRGKVTALTKKKIMVHFIDFGNETTFELTSLRDEVIFAMPPNLKVYPAMSRRFQLFNIPSKPFDADEDQVKTYKLLDRKLFRFRVEEMTPDGEPVVSLSTEEDKYFNSTMKCSLFPTAQSKLNRAKDLRYIDLAPGEQHRGIIHKIKGKEVFLSLVEDVHYAQDISLRVHEIFRDKHSRYTACVNEIVIVRVKDTFHRAIARDVGPERVRCELFDIAQERTVDPANVFPLTNSVEDFPCLAIKCQVLDDSHVRYFQRKCQKQGSVAFKVTSKQNGAFVIEPSRE